MPRAFSLFNYIYPGPFMDEEGRFDNRIWFFIPMKSDIKKKTATYLKFPYGGKEEDFVEEEIDISWL